MNKLIIATALLAASSTLAQVMPIKYPKVQPKKFFQVTSMEKMVEKSEAVKKTSAPSGKVTAKKGSEGVGGGGGIVRNGLYLTIGSAGVWVDPIPAAETDIPGMRETLEIVSSTTVLSSSDKSVLYDSLLPTDERKYYRVNNDYFDEETKNRLTDEYEKLSNTPRESIVIFAVTDTKRKITYLLPGFYELSPIEQKTILIHEAYWLVKPFALYQDVIRAEVAAQKYLENPRSFSAIRDFAKYFSRSKVATVFPAIDSDHQNNIENGITSNDESSFKIKVSHLLGQEFYDCRSRASDCLFAFKNHWLKLKIQNPESQAIAALADLFLVTTRSTFIVQTENSLFPIEVVMKPDMEVECHFIPPKEYRELTTAGTLSCEARKPEKRVLNNKEYEVFVFVGQFSIILSSNSF